MVLIALILSLSLPIVQSDRQGQSFPHLKIDWSKRRVEVDGIIGLREGYLELVACTPNTREHESIVVVPARPLHVWQALGLLGIESGHPPRWDPERRVVIPARGARLDITVRYRRDGVMVEHPVQEWLWDANREAPCPPMTWVLAGSIIDPEYGMAADTEGTVISVVDFETALISLDVSYSADNTALWLVPRPDRIPPLGTDCTLIIAESAAAPVHRVDIGPFGRMRYDGRVVGLEALGEVVRGDLADDEAMTVDIVADAWALEVDRRAALEAVLAAGLPAGRVRERIRASNAAEPGTATLSIDVVRAAWQRLAADADQATSGIRLLQGLGYAAVQASRAVRTAAAWLEARLPTTADIESMRAARPDGS